MITLIQKNDHRTDSIAFLLTHGLQMYKREALTLTLDLHQIIHPETKKQINICVIFTLSLYAIERGNPQYIFVNLFCESFCIICYLFIIFFLVGLKEA